MAKNDHMPVGHYGNGFKSGSMRLGKEAIVFTKQENSRSVGFLSQNYLEAVKAQTILVPIVSWDADDNILLELLIVKFVYMSPPCWFRAKLEIAAKIHVVLLYNLTRKIQAYLLLAWLFAI